MPNTASAKKRVRSTARKTNVNKKWKRRYKSLVSEVRKNGFENTSPEELQKILDKAAKKGVIHENKAARLKSKLMSNSAHGKKR